MKKYMIPILILLFQFHALTGQKYSTKEGRIHFLSVAPLEKIEASNNNALVVLDASNGQMEWSVLIKGFKFAKALMQTHFNENYLESHKYPKGVFKGTIINIQEINFQKDGTYPANMKGDLTIHGVTQPFVTSGKVTIKGDKISASSTFDVTVSDFKIEIPKVVRDNIAKTVKVSVNADLHKMK